MRRCRIRLVGAYKYQKAARIGCKPKAPLNRGRMPAYAGIGASLKSELGAEIVAEKHCEFVEIAVWIDVADFRDEGLGIDEVAERDEAVIELADHGDHVTVEIFFDERDVSADAEAAAQHDVESVRRCATGFITELYAVNLDFGKVALFEAFHDELGDEMTDVDVAQGDVAVFVTRGGGEEIGRKFFGKAFGEDDDAEFLTASAARHDEIDDVIDEDVEIEETGEFLASGEHESGDVFHADDHLSLTGHCDAVGEPAGLAAHAFRDEVGLSGACVGFEVADFLRHEVDGREEAEREVDAVVVVVDCLGQMDDADFVVNVRVFLELIEFVGCFERVVAADGDEGVDAEAAEAVVGAAQRRGLFGVIEVGRAGDHFTRVRAGGADHDTALVACADNPVEIQDDVCVAFDERHALFIEVLQARIAVKEADDFDAGFHKGKRCRRNDGICAGCRTTGKENTNATNTRFCICHFFPLIKTG